MAGNGKVIAKAVINNQTDTDGDDYDDGNDDNTIKGARKKCAVACFLSFVRVQITLGDY